tara:strand:+ start:571 stop:675 length:105 start_codon:yes stop_codon:yes gene_type:complete
MAQGKKASERLALQSVKIDADFTPHSLVQNLTNG